MDVYPIAEEFFQRLLHDTDPIEPVHTLYSRWSVRRTAAAPWLGLSRPEYQVTLVLEHLGAAGSIGDLFFSGGGGESVRRVRSALQEIGLEELDTLLAQACALFADGQVPAEQAEVERAIEGWPEDKLAELRRLERMAWATQPLPRIIQYLREHESEVLAPERGLPTSRLA